MAGGSLIVQLLGSDADMPKERTEFSTLVVNEKAAEVKECPEIIV